MKKIKMLALILSFTMVLSACSQKTEPAKAPATTSETGSAGSSLEELPELSLTLGYSSPEGISGDVATKEGAKNLSDKTNNKFNITIYPAAQLGGDREEIEATQLGDQDIWKGATSALVTFIPELAIFDMPMAFADYNHDQIAKALNGEVGDFNDKISEKFDNAGLKLLGFSTTDISRTMSSNIPVHSIDDFKGIRIRTMENKYHINFWKEIGCSPTPVNFSELYIALQQGVVDAQENPVVGLVGSGQYEQQKYITDTNHILMVTCYIMNKAKYDGLTPAQIELLDGFINEVRDKEYELSKPENEAIEKKAKDAGIEFITLDEATKAAIKEKAQSTVDLVSKDVGQDLVDSLFNSLKETTK